MTKKTKTIALIAVIIGITVPVYMLTNEPDSTFERPAIQIIKLDPVDQYTKKMEKEHQETIKRNERILRETLNLENEYQTHKEKVYLPVMEKQKALGDDLEAHFEVLKSLELLKIYDELSADMGINQIATTTSK